MGSAYPSASSHSLSIRRQRWTGYRENRSYLRVRGSFFIVKITSLLRLSHLRQVKVIRYHWLCSESSGKHWRLKPKPPPPRELDRLLATVPPGRKTQFRKCLQRWYIFITAREARSRERKTMWGGKLNRCVVCVLGQAHRNPPCIPHVWRPAPACTLSELSWVYMFCFLSLPGYFSLRTGYTLE